MLKILFDKMLAMLLVAIVLASFFPLDGQGEVWFALATKASVALLFFLHGARLSYGSVVAGLIHWRLHGIILFTSFALFPLIGLLASFLVPALKQSPFYLGILYLCVLPSTVQSSIAFTSIAGGNVAAAIVAASASNIFGMFFTPLLVGLLLSLNTDSSFSIESFYAILGQLFLPFAIGQCLQYWLGDFFRQHKGLTSLVDRGSILMVVFLAFSIAAREGLWHQVSKGDLGMMLIFDIVLLALILGITWWGAKFLHFSRPDCLTIMFCGSKKSLASGAPMANAIFSNSAAVNIGMVVLPIMLFHQIQLMVCTVIAQYWAQQLEKPHD